jgi:hypothetical protein
MFIFFALSMDVLKGYRLFEVKVIYFLIILIFASYCVLLVLSLHPDFKEGYKEGATQCFENVLMVGTFFILFYGIWINGYKEGLKERCLRKKSE